MIQSTELSIKLKQNKTKIKLKKFYLNKYSLQKIIYSSFRNNI